MIKRAEGLSAVLLLPLLTFTLLIVGCQNEFDDNAEKSDAVAVKAVQKMDTTSSSADKKAGDIDGKITRHQGEVRRNDSFYRILDRLGVSPQRIYKLTSSYREKLERFQLKPGQKYRYELRSTDSTRKLTMLTWFPSRRDLVEIYIEDSIDVKIRQKPVKTKIKGAHGVIESSLYETFLDQQLPVALAYKLSDLFAWQIDFFTLRKGDAFKVIYNEQYVDDKLVGIGSILAAEFTHRDQTYVAFRFYNGEEMGYYDTKGKSLQKALLKAPLRFRYISSGYSHSRYHPILHRRMPHYGIDYVAPAGTPVVTVGDGTVVTAGYNGPNGNMVKIKHNGTYTTTYIHLSRFADGIHRGVEVTQGEVIGFVGSTGRSTGSHLDYRLYRNGRPVNPRTVDLPPTKSIDDEYMKAFRYANKQMGKQLDELKFNRETGQSTVTHKKDVNSDEDDVGKSS